MNDEAVEDLRKAGAVAREARILGAGMVAEGVALLDVAEEVESFIIRKGARPAFPVNISINDIAAHYSPRSDDTLKFTNGDLVKVDVGAHVNGYIGDTAQTVEVGTKNWGDLIESSSKALNMAIESVHDGVPVCTLGAAIERGIVSNGYKPITNLTGHGMKQYTLHAGLSITNYDDGSSTRLTTGMTIAIEPFATNGDGQVQNGKSGNIYRLMRPRDLKDQKAMVLFNQIRSDFGNLPFCERWCTAIDPDAQTHLRTLVRHGLIFAYPILREERGGMVSQTEHTVHIHANRVEVTT